MTLPISTIVQVNVSIAPTIPPKPGFGIAAVVTGEDTKLLAPQTERIMFYASITSVGEDWDTGSETYKSALSYFSQQPSPTTFATIAKYSTQSTALVTGTIAADPDFNNWILIADGEFAITIDGITANVTVDFTGGGIVDMLGVGDAINAALNLADPSPAFVNAAAEWVVDHFEISGDAFGGTITATSPVVAGVGTNISLLMATDESIVGVQVVQGTDVESDVDALNAAEQVDNSWYGVLILKDQRDVQTTLDVAAWTEARSKIFSCSTNNASTLVLGSTNNIAAQLQTLNYTRTTCIYSSQFDEYPDAAVLGKAFTVNFNAPDSVITLKFKPLAGITTESISETQKNALDNKRANALIDVGNTSMYAESYMSSQLFFDERHSIDWLVGEIQSNTFGYTISRPTKVPLTDKGGAAIEQQVIRAMDSGVNNGMLAPGTTSGGVFLGNGYVTTVQKVADIAPADRANRLGPVVSFICLLSGAVHFIQINGVVER